MEFSLALPMEFIIALRDSWSEFVDKNFRMYTRYFRDQYHDALKKFSQGIKREHLRQAIDLCLENRTYSMAIRYLSVLPTGSRISTTKGKNYL